MLGNIILLCAVHYNYNALSGGLHEICSTACSFDLRYESVTYFVVSIDYYWNDYFTRIPSNPSEITNPAVQMRILRAFRPTFRQRNIITALGILGWAAGLYGFTIMSVKQESFLDDLDDNK